MESAYELIPLVGRTAVAAVFLYIYRLQREPWLFYWTAAWTLLAAHYLAHLRSVAQDGVPGLLTAADSLLLALACVVFLHSARSFARRQAGVGTSAILSGVFLGWTLLHNFSGLSALRALAPEIGSGFVAGATGWLFWRESTRRDITGGRILAMAFGLWAVALLGEPLGRTFESFFVPYAPALVSLPEQLIAMCTLMAFYEEDKRSAERDLLKHLTLLNNISRKAISTLEPEEMLGEIASEIHTHLPYDHIGIGVLDYANREVVIQAEAGRSAQGLNQRIKLGEGSIGEVVTTGSVHQVDAIASAGERERWRTILPDAGSVVALPLLYADQMLGVLNVESRQPRAFSPEDVKLLRTLADQVASALHNALAFQKAKEQAITDGLTGVKTHRFFMEALNAEWRRATRVGRHFSLLMLDLDKFKFVNDYYGHLEGDAVLQRTGGLLAQNCRRSDVVARYGGDEFVVLMPETNAEQAYTLAEKLRTCFASDSLLGEKKLTPSLGLATFPTHASTPPELIQLADASMYLAKHQGGNAVVSADHYRASEQNQWQRSVLEAYLGVTIKRLSATGPEAFEEVYRRLQGLAETFGADANSSADLPPEVVETVTSLASAVDAKDASTQGHSQNVARYSVALGRRLGLPEPDLEELRLAAILHDLGKVGIPETLLGKSARLDPEGFDQMKEHAVLGAKLLEPLRALARIQTIVRHHHERVDGSGYPDGLEGEAIPLASRIIAIAEAFDAMLTGRSYMDVRTRAEAVEELRRCAGTQFDPMLVKEFLEILAGEGDRPSP